MFSKPCNAREHLKIERNSKALCGLWDEIKNEIERKDSKTTKISIFHSES